MSNTKTPCGDRIERDGDALVIDAALPIDGLVASKYRRAVLVYDGERFVLDSVRDQNGYLTYFLRRELDNIYVVAGAVVVYDGERHLERRAERKRTALAWALWLPTVFLLPLLGLLPAGVKQKLIHIGVDVGRATRMSVAVEWLLVFALVVAYPFMGGFFTLPGFVDGALALFVALDIAYRVTADAGGETPGLFGVGPAIAVWLKGIAATARGKDRLLDDDEARAAIAPRVHTSDNTSDDARAKSESTGQAIDAPDIKRLR